MDEERQRVNLKLQYRYSGPHMVTKIYGPVVYQARMNGEIVDVHASKMKRDPAHPNIIRYEPVNHLYDDKTVRVMMQELEHPAPDETEDPTPLDHGMELQEETQDQND